MKEMKQFLWITVCFVCVCVCVCVCVQSITLCPLLQIKALSLKNVLTVPENQRYHIPTGESINFDLLVIYKNQLSPRGLTLTWAYFTT